MLEEIKSELHTLHTKVNRILVNQGGQNQEDLTITEEVALPISSIDKLQELEGHLSKVAYEKYLVCTFVLSHIINLFYPFTLIFSFV